MFSWLYIRSTCLSCLGNAAAEGFVWKKKQAAFFRLQLQQRVRTLLPKHAPQNTRTTPSLTASFGYLSCPLPCLSFAGFVSQPLLDTEHYKDDQSTMTMMMQQAGRRHASLAAFALLGLQLTTTMAFVFPASSLSAPSQGRSLGWSPLFLGRKRTPCSSSLR